MNRKIFSQFRTCDSGQKFKHAIAKEFNSNKVDANFIHGLWQQLTSHCGTNTKRLLRLPWVVILFLFNGFLYAQDYPPAQGPPDATAPGGVSNSVITSLIQTRIQEAVDGVNALIRLNEPSTGVKATVTFTKKVYKPGISVTDYINRPNQRVVRIAINIHYTIGSVRWHGIPYFSRELYQSITLYVSCNNWFTTYGAIRVDARIDQPYLEGPSFPEEALNIFFNGALTNYVDSKVRSILPPALQTAFSIPSRCNCLGVDPGTAPGYENGEIRYSYMTPPLGPPPSVFKIVSVTLQSIKRLSARTDRGSILYSPEEDIQLEFYANQEMRSAVLDNMIEGEERALNVPTITLNRPKSNELLVLIANIQQLPYYEDSRFVILRESTNFGNGARTIIVQKKYSTQFRLPDGSLSKPRDVFVNAYEIKLYIKALLPNVAIPPNDAPVARAGKDLTIRLPLNSVTLNGMASSDPDGNIRNYAWTKLSGPSSSQLTENSATMQVKNMVEGKYIFSLKVTDNEGATNADTVVINVKKLEVGFRSATSVSSPDVLEKNVSVSLKQESLYVYPNPGSHVINISYRFENADNAKLNIYDVQGKLIITKGFDRQKGVFNIMVNVSSLNSGLYYVELKFDNGSSVTKKFIKQ